MLFAGLFLCILGFSTACISTGVPGCECTRCACAAGGARPSPIVRPTEIVPLAVVHPVAAPSYISSPTPKDPFSQLESSYPIQADLAESPLYIAPANKEIPAMEPRVYEMEVLSNQLVTTPLTMAQSEQQQSSYIAQPPLPPAYVPSQHEEQDIIPVTSSGYGVDSHRAGPGPAPPSPFRETGVVHKASTPPPAQESGQLKTSLSAMQVHETSAMDHDREDARPQTRISSGIAKPYAEKPAGQIQVKSSDLVTEASIDMAQEKPLFLTYYNQECSGVMVHMAQGKSIIAATDECLRIGCEAINTQILAGNEYMFTYLTKARSRTNKKSNYCISLRAVPVQKMESSHLPSKFQETSRRILSSEKPEEYVL